LYKNKKRQQIRSFIFENLTDLV